MIRFLVSILLAWFAGSAAAQDLLDPEKAFRLSVQPIDSNTLELHYRIAEGYYVYRERFKFEARGVRSPDSR